MKADNLSEAINLLCCGRRGDQTQASFMLSEQAREKGITEKAESVRCKLSRIGTGVESPDLFFLQRVEDVRRVFTVTEYLVLRDPEIARHIAKKLEEAGYLGE